MFNSKLLAKLLMVSALVFGVSLVSGCSSGNPVSASGPSESVGMAKSLKNEKADKEKCDKDKKQKKDKCKDKNNGKKDCDRGKGHIQDCDEEDDQTSSNIVQTIPISTDVCTEPDPTTGKSQCTVVVGTIEIVLTPSGDSTVTTTTKQTVTRMQNGVVLSTSIADKVLKETWNAGIQTYQLISSVLVSKSEVNGVCTMVTTTSVYEMQNDVELQNTRTQVSGACL